MSDSRFLRLQELEILPCGFRFGVMVVGVAGDLASVVEGLGCSLSKRIALLRGVKFTGVEFVGAGLLIGVEFCLSVLTGVNRTSTADWFCIFCT
jgi:hypothetical protein